LGEKNVGGFDIAMDEPLGVGMRDACEDLTHRDDGFRGRQGALALDQLSERAAFHVFENDVGCVERKPHFVDRHDIGMRQAARRASLPQEPVETILATFATDGEPLDGDEPAQLRVRREIDGTLCASTQYANDAKPSDNVGGRRSLGRSSGFHGIGASSWAPGRRAPLPPYGPAPGNFRDFPAIV
jgi:hypothetical protein